MGRQIRKTVIKYTNVGSNVTNNSIDEKRDRSRQKNDFHNEQALNNHQQALNRQSQKGQKQKIVEEVVDTNSRKARLQALKKAKQLREEEQNKSMSLIKNVVAQQKCQMPQIIIVSQNKVKISQATKNIQTQNLTQLKQNINQQSSHQKITPSQNIKLQHNDNQFKQLQSDQDEPELLDKVLLKPVFISKQNRTHIDEEELLKQKQDQRKKINLKYTTKLLLQQDKKNAENQQDEEQDINNQDQQNQTNLPDDDDTKNQQLQYQLWKIRELKRIRKEKEDRQKHIIEKAQIQRRRNMDNEQILLQNRLLGSDSTDHQTQTKYVFMQKYYHKGAFYQDSQDPIFKRDYNLPTPMEMQDKSSLPQVLQKRKGDFGKRGQSKYTHLNAQDTTDNNPLTRPDESLLNGWKKKMAGYKN